ncbi:MAG: hypothetical protein AAF846_10695 [Chloroflexota bacterium]
MSDIAEKQRIARETTKLFQDLCEDCPDEDFEVWEAENDPPDIFFQNSNIGLEITDYVRHDSQSGREILSNEDSQQKLVEKAKSLYEEKHPNKPLMVDFDWLSGAKPYKNEMGKLAKEIVQLIERANLHEVETIEYEDFEDMLVRKYLHSINVYLNKDDMRHETGNLWKSDSAAWVGLSPNEIIYRVRKKESYLPKIRDNCPRCNEFWLLIVAWSKPSLATHAIPIEAIEYTLSTDFDRVYFLNQLSKQCFRVK